jgi:hypothetical protein
MPTILLLRLNALTPSEVKKLPRECVPVTDSNTIVARADIPRNPMAVMVKLAVAMGRAIPDADFAFHEVTLPGGNKVVPRKKVPSKPSPHQDDENSEEMEAEIIDVEPEEEWSEEEETWWDLLEDGKPDEALEALSQGAPSPEERLKLRSYLNSPDSAHVEFICRAVRKMKWTSFIVSLRKAFAHKSAAVRREAVTAIGELAGPSLSPAVHLLLSDPDASVQKAARLAYKKLRR